MTFIKRLMEIKERQLELEVDQRILLHEILKVLEGRKDGKRKISRKN